MKYNIEDQTWGANQTRMDVTQSGVSIIENYGNTRFEAGGEVTHQEYIQGRYNNIVKDRFNEDVHLEVLKLCKQWVQEKDKTK